jgi:hypothetical protein
MSECVRCPLCQMGLLQPSGKCPKCGYRADNRKRRADGSPFLLKRWDSRRPLYYQASAVIALVALVVVLVLESPRLGGAWLLGLVVLAALAAVAGYQLLSYSVTLRRDGRGRLVVQKRRYFAWIIPLWSLSVSVADYDTVRTDWHGPDSSATRRFLNDDEADWRQDIYILELYRQRDGAKVTVYRGPDEELMKDLADVLREHAGLLLTRK